MNAYSDENLDRLEAEIVDLKAENAELRDALQSMVKWQHGGYFDGLWHGPDLDKARAVLAKVSRAPAEPLEPKT